jgi:hypothetical protein
MRKLLRIGSLIIDVNNNRRNGEDVIHILTVKKAELRVR